jgi:hypothetical protein
MITIRKIVRKINNRKGNGEEINFVFLISVNMIDKII